MSTIIDRLKEDIRRTEFLDHDWVRVPVNELESLLAVVQAVGNLPMAMPTTLAEWQASVSKFEAVKAAYRTLIYGTSA